ncbi:hypothetical protein MPSEU_000665100 [Mayamaea pseudoterrestris]|nr:hypothetical protein MPSEU_000665100 [Mayamaea pseudoterrestris]
MNVSTLLLALLCVQPSLARISLIDTVAAGLQNVGALPSQTTSIVTVISSPGTPSALNNDESEVSSVLSAEETASGIVLYCRGSTLGGTSQDDRTSLALCSLVSGALLVDGVTMGDVEAGLQNSRHARTLTALFRSRIKLTESDESKQTLIIGLVEVADGDKDKVAESVERDVKALYKASAVEKKGSLSFEDAYDLQIRSVASAGDADSILSLATEAARSSERSSEAIGSMLNQKLSQVRESGVAALALDTPHIAQAFVQVGNAYQKQSRVARARIASWKSRVARGLWVDGFGKEAEGLRKRVLGSFDAETLPAAGLPLVSAYRLEMRSQLQSLLDSAVEELYGSQISNLEKATIKRLEKQLLRTVNEPSESAMDTNAAAMRTESYQFESIAEDLQVPVLGLTKEKAVREMSARLNDVMTSFPDSPQAKIKRTQQVSKVVNRERKPSTRAIDFGLDVVAVVRPDGFGSLQGYAGYNLPGGNSITFGVHNDADDPQVIAQFGGVRPPLLRIQPKLRVNVEL